MNEAGPEGNDDAKSTVTRKTIQSTKRGGVPPSQKTEKTEMKSESKKIKSSPSQNVKSSNRLIGQQKQEQEFVSNTGLSKRGVQALLPTKDEKEIQLTKVSYSDVYKAKTNPNGYLNMLVEENHLMHTALKEKLQLVCKNEEIPDSVFESQDW